MEKIQPQIERRQSAFFFLCHQGESRHLSIVQRAGLMPHGQGPCVNASKRNAFVNHHRLLGFTVVGQGDYFVNAAFVMFPTRARHGIVKGIVH